MLVNTFNFGASNAAGIAMSGNGCIAVPEFKGVFMPKNIFDSPISLPVNYSKRKICH